MSQVIIAPRSAHEVLHWSRTEVDPALRAAVDELPASPRHVAGYHQGWWDADGRPDDGDDATTVHAALALLAAEAVGGGAEQALPAAVAIELAHHHALVHGALMDRDDTPRHRPAAWSVFGDDPAIEAGDALLTSAFDVLARSGSPSAVRGVHVLNAAVLAVVDGLIIDLDCAEREHVDTDDSLRTAAAKSGALMACACALGAVFADGLPEQVEHLHAFGEDVGLALRHVEDQHSVHRDLRLRRRSLPVVAAMTSSTPAGHELAALHQHEEPVSEADVRYLADLVDAAGGREWSVGQVDALLARALHHLRSAQPSVRAADELFALARLATRRDR